MPSTSRPSAVDADVRRQHLNAEPLWPSLITHDPQTSGRDTTLAPAASGRRRGESVSDTQAGNGVSVESSASSYTARFAVRRVVLPAVARERGCRRTWEQLHALDWDAKGVSVAA